MILTLNIGSSTLKYAVFDGDRPVCRHTIDVHEDGLSAAVADMLQRPELQHITLAAHRIVHGGERFTAPTVLTPSIEAALHDLTPWAPLHQPHNLAGVTALRTAFPHIPHVGCFDTAFHADLPKLTRSFALPERLRAIRRYGFHGLSYAGAARELRAQGVARAAVAHLGSGASVCALLHGRSHDVTTGLTALDGLPMATRCGSLDPGAALYLHDSGVDADVLYRESGLKGLSGISGDMRVLLAADHPRARFAVDYFCLHAAKHIAALSIALGGLDRLIFTGGIGENAPDIRTRIVQHLWFTQALTVHVRAADEEAEMALQIREMTS